MKQLNGAVLVVYTHTNVLLIVLRPYVINTQHGHDTEKRHVDGRRLKVRTDPESLTFTFTASAQRTLVVVVIQGFSHCGGK